MVAPRIGDAREIPEARPPPLARKRIAPTPTRMEAIRTATKPPRNVINESPRGRRMRVTILAIPFPITPPAPPWRRTIAMGNLTLLPELVSQARIAIRKLEATPTIAASAKERAKELPF